MPDQAEDPFNDYIDNHLDLSAQGIDGIACQIVHPIVEDVLASIEHNEKWADCLTPAQHQVTECLTQELMARMIRAALEGTEPGFAVASGRDKDNPALEIEPDALTRMLVDAFSSLRLADMTVSARLQTDGLMEMPAAFIQLIIYNLQLFTALAKLNNKRDRETAENVSVMVEEGLEFVLQYAKQLAALGLLEAINPAELDYNLNLDDPESDGA